jgi:UDP-N-acetylglucosamine 2-epimerase (non-hydrolysing)
MQPDQSLGAFTARILGALDEVFDAVRPDLVLVQGDTTTVMAASPAAFYRRIRVGHVEAGLRSGDTFPEEINRRVADVLADLFFAPALAARKALLREGAPPNDVLVTSDTVVDALLNIAQRIDGRALLARAPGLILNKRKRLILVTSHRRESFGAPFAETYRVYGRWPSATASRRRLSIRSTTTQTSGSRPARCWVMSQKLP